jgi:hypothetical protein
MLGERLTARVKEIVKGHRPKPLDPEAKRQVGKILGHAGDNSPLFFPTRARRVAATTKMTGVRGSSPYDRITATSQAGFERNVAAVRTALGDNAFAAGGAEGQAMMPPEEAVAYAMAK